MTGDFKIKSCFTRRLLFCKIVHHLDFYDTLYKCIAYHRSCILCHSRLYLRRLEGQLSVPPNFTNAAKIFHIIKDLNLHIKVEKVVLVKKNCVNRFFLFFAYSKMGMSSIIFESIRITFLLYKGDNPLLTTPV